MQKIYQLEKKYIRQYYRVFKRVNDMKCVFMLASVYGMKCLEAVLTIPCIELVGVITAKEHYELRYDKGRYIKHMRNEIYHMLLEKCYTLNLPMHVIEKMNDENTIRSLEKWNPDLIIVSGWYHLIGNYILNLPRKGVIGLHPSLLPKYRGGAPLVWQIINGEKYAGITLFYMDDGVDSGDIIGQKKVDIEYTDTIKSLYCKVGEKGIELLREYLPQIEKECSPRKKQTDLNDQDIWPQRNPADGEINWRLTSRQIYDFIRAQTKPYPGAFTHYEGERYSIWEAEITRYSGPNREPGTILDTDEREGSFLVASGDKATAIKVTAIQPRGLESEDKQITIFEKEKAFY